MIYLIPNWELDRTDFDRDGILYLSRLLERHGIENKIVLINSQPFMNHYAQFFGVKQEQLLPTFDTLQDIQVPSGHPIGVQDLNYPSSIEKIYSQKELLLVRNNKLYGRIIPNMFGFVDRAVYYEEDGLQIDIYDERGFISQKEYFDKDHVLIKREYLNCTAVVTISEYLNENGRVVIEKGHRKLPEGMEFSNINTFLSHIFKEMLHTADLTNDRVVISVSPSAMEIVENLEGKDEFIYNVSSTDSLEELQATGWLKSILTKPKLLTEAAPKRDEIWAMQRKHDITKSNMPVVPMHFTAQNFGDSNTIKELITFWSVGFWEKMTVRTFEMLLDKLKENDEMQLLAQIYLRQVKLEDMEEVIRRTLKKHFAIELTEKELERTTERSKNTYSIKKDFFDIDEIEEGTMQALQEADEYLKRIEIQANPMTIEILERFRLVRLFVELSTIPDYFYHAMAVGRGIPILSREQTAYMIDGKNGKLVKNFRDLQEGLDTYLDLLNPWNRALVTAIDIIEENSEENLINQWRDLLNVKTESEVA